MSTYWCEWAWLGGDAVTAGVRLEVEGDRLVAVSAGPAGEGPPPSATRLEGVTVPGLVNADSHAFHRVLRGRAQAAGSFWTWRDQMYAVAARLDPDTYHRLARAVFGEMALAGITTVGEFHYLHHGPDGRPYDDLNTMGAAVVAAADEVGVRLTLLNTCYLHGGVDADLDDVQRRFGDGSVDRWAARSGDLALAAGSRLRVGAAVHSVRALTPTEVAAVAAVAGARGWPLHAHVSEQPAENDACRAAYGRTPTEVLAHAGALGPSFTAVHATHVTASDLAALASGSVCLCPTTERDLADGTGPAATMAASGVGLCLGSDSHAVIDLFEEARAVELDERLATGLRGHQPPADLLRAATTGGAEALGWPEVGRLEAGSLADFTTVSLGSARLAGTRRVDALAALVFAATAADVHHVVVGGRVVVRDGRHVSLDVAGELAAAIRGFPT